MRDQRRAGRRVSDRARREISFGVLPLFFEIDDSLFPGSRACLFNPPAPMADQPNWACTCMRRGCEVEYWLLGGTCPSFESREKKTAVKLDGSKHSMSNT